MDLTLIKSLKQWNRWSRKLSLPVLLIVISCQASSQFYSIDANISGLPVNRIVLTRVHGDDLITIDSLISTKQEFRFILPQNSPAGLYRIILGKSKRAEFMGGPPQSIDLILNHENVSLVSSFNSPADSLRIIKSEENKIYYAFLNEFNQLEYRIRQIYSLLSNYPKNTDFYKNIITEFHTLQKEQNLLIDKTCQKYTGTFASKIIKMYKTPFLEGSWTEMERVLFMREHYFDGLDFKDSLLLNTNIYTKKVIDYLSLYRNPNLVQSEQEDLFIDAVDKILMATNQDKVVYEFILDYLVKGFEKFKFEKVLTHIADNWLGDNCETGNKSLLLKRVESYRKMAPGNIAPDIIMKDINGEITALSGLGHDNILVLFWASWCPHCQSMIPELRKWYNEKRKIDMEIFAISVDTSFSEWSGMVKDEQMPWINCNEPGGWDGKAASDYNLYATPTMFILDRTRKILAKPVTFYEFVREVEKL